MARAAFGNRRSAAGIAANAAASAVAATGGSREAQLDAGRRAASTAPGGATYTPPAAPIVSAPSRGVSTSGAVAGTTNAGVTASDVAAARAAALAPTKAAAPSSVGAFGNRTSSAGIAANTAAAAAAARGESKSSQLAAGVKAAKELLAGATPEVQQQFQKYNDFLNQLDQMPEDQRAKALGEIQAQASSAVDPYFDAEKGLNQEERDLLQKQSQARLDASNAQAQKTYDRGYEDLTSQASDVLGTTDQNLFSRGGQDSGLEKSYADRVIEARGKSLDRAGEDLAKSKELAAQGFDLSTQGNDLTLREKNRQLEFDRSYYTGLEQNDIMGDLERYNYLMTGPSSSIAFDSSNPAPISSSSRSASNTSSSSSQSTSGTGKTEAAINRSISTPSFSSPSRVGGRVDPSKVLVDLRTRTYSTR